MSDIVERLRSNALLPVCPYDRRSPDYWTAPNDKPCVICGQENTIEGPDLCRGADTRVMEEAANEIERLRGVAQAAPEHLPTYGNLLAEINKAAHAAGTNAWVRDVLKQAHRAIRLSAPVSSTTRRDPVLHDERFPSASSVTSTNCEAPGHTDLMVTPESIDAWLEKNPLPECGCGGDPDQPSDHHDISCPFALPSTQEKSP